jgi:activator of Hsp90 ATPase-like protein
VHNLKEAQRSEAIKEFSARLVQVAGRAGHRLELRPHERIHYTNKFENPNLPGEMQTTIALKQVFCGTQLNITQEGIPAAIPAEACYLGWQESLTLLAKLVEVEIPDQP